MDKYLTSGLIAWFLACHANKGQASDFAGQPADTDLACSGLALDGSHDWLTLRGSHKYSETDIYVAALGLLYGALQQVDAGAVTGDVKVRLTMA